LLILSTSKLQCAHTIGGTKSFFSAVGNNPNIKAYKADNGNNTLKSVDVDAKYEADRLVSTQRFAERSSGPNKHRKYFFIEHTTS